MTRQPVLNTALLDATLAEVRKAARRKGGNTWNQEVYRRKDSCGTAMCFAGWAVTLDGGKWLDDFDYCTLRRGQPRFDALPTMYWVDGKPTTRASRRARRALGLTLFEADLLFAANNSLRDLSRIVGQIKSGALR